MKIVAKDNLDRDYVSDFLICENVNKPYGKRFVDYLNKSEGESSINYYVLVEDNYKLYEWEA